MTYESASNRVAIFPISRQHIILEFSGCDIWPSFTAIGNIYHLERETL